MSYDPWLIEEPSTSDMKLLRIELAEIEKEIAWNERLLENLVLRDDDREQTEDYIADLRQERQRLLTMLGNVLVPVKSLWDMNASWHQPSPSEEAGLVEMREDDRRE
jgi:predicted nuclease with TOPRIM domain